MNREKHRVQAYYVKVAVLLTEELSTLISREEPAIWNTQRCIYTTVLCRLHLLRVELICQVFKISQFCYFKGCDTSLGNVDIHAQANVNITPQQHKPHPLCLGLLHAPSASLQYPHIQGHLQPVVEVPCPV